MSRRSENSYEEMASNGSTWRDKLTDEHTFEDWQLHKHQIRTMMNTSSSEPMPLHRFEVESNGRTVDSNGRSSGRFSNAIYGDRHSEPRRPHSAKSGEHSSKSGEKKERRVKKRVLFILLGVIGVIAVAVPVVVVMLLRKSDGSAPEAKVGTVDLEVSIQNMQFSEALANPESEDYRNFTLQFCQEMETFYRRSSIGDKYDGCLVQELRQGSIIVVFTLVFSSEYLPIDTAVRKVFTDNATPTQSGTLAVTLGIYVITDSSIIVGQVTIIANDKNPTPRIGHGQSCKVTAACKTYQAVCANEKCGCGPSRRYSSSSDSCILLPTTTTSSSTKPTTVLVTTSTTTKQQTTAESTTDITTSPVQTTESTTVTTTPSVSTSTKSTSTPKSTTSPETTTSTSTKAMSTTSESKSTSVTPTKEGSTSTTQTPSTTESASSSASSVLSTTKLTSSTSIKVETSTESGTPSKSSMVSTKLTSESTAISSQSTSEPTTLSSHPTSKSTASSPQPTSESTSSSPQSTTNATTFSSQSTPISTKSSSEATLSTSDSPRLTSTEILTTTSPFTPVTTSTKHTTPTSPTVSVTSSTSSSTQSATSTPSSTTNTPSTSSSTTASTASTSSTTASSTATPSESSTTSSPSASSSSTTASPTSTSSSSTASPTTTTSTVTTTSSTSSSTTATSTTSSSTSQSTASSTATPLSTPSTPTSSTTTSTQSTSTSSVSISTAVTTDLTSPSTHLTTHSSSIETSTPTQESTTQPALEVIPTISFISPTNRRLDIGTEGGMHYLIDNVIDWMVVTLTKPTSGSDAPVFIGDFTIQNGTSEGASYGDYIDHIRIDILSFDISVSFNLTVRFDPVKCSDGGAYLCSVTAPAYSHGPIELLEDIEAYSTRVVQLSFPYELREGLWGLDIGCSATLGADETLSLLRKQPGETEFTEFMPAVQKPAELRRNDSVDPDFPCIKEATYYFDTDLEGWNMTEIRCAINVDTVDEVLSDIGAFRVVPRSVCDDFDAGENVPHPFNCKMYVTCTADHTTWGYVHRSNCPGDECWLPDGKCGTTTTVTTTTPGTTTPTTTRPPHLPYITCSPAIRYAYTGGNVSYACAVHNVEIVKQVQVVSSQFIYEQIDDNGLNGTFIDDPVTLMVDLEAENQISITLASLACDMEGELTISVNGNLSDSVTLRILSDPQMPELSIPENIYKNQMTYFNCSGKVGRVENGSQAVTLGFEILPEGQTESISISGQSVIVLSNVSDNCENHIIIQYRILAIDEMNGAVLSCVSTSNADQSRQFIELSKPFEVLEANIFFDKDLEYKVAMRDTLSLTCSFQNLQDVHQLKITRGENKDVVLVLHRNGTVDQPLNHFALSSSDWGDDTGAVTITANITCGDENLYTCEADSNSGEAVVLITVFALPETPTLTLSYELIEGQGAWSDRLSECKAQIGDPAGNLVIEILNGDVFQEYEIEYGTGYPQSRSLECGIEQTIQFYFSDLVGLNNTEIRCAVKPNEVFNDTENIVSESQIIQTVDGSYCVGIDASLYVHPYDCHYFVDCNRYGSNDFHFNQCNNPDECPNPSRGICDIESCDTLCNRGPKPYLRCNGIIEAELNDAVSISCELGNVETISLEMIAVLQDETVILNETWASGTASTPDDSVTLIYTAGEVIVNIAQVQCQQDAVYTIIINDLLSDSSTVIIKTNAIAPVISSTRFVAGQLATITCDGNVGNPQESNQLFIEGWATDGPLMTVGFVQVQPTSDVTEFSSTSCSYERRVVLTIEIMEMMNGIIQFRCRTATESGNLISDTVYVNVAPQEIEIQPAESKVAVGVALSIECTVEGVSGLTDIRFYRGNDTSQTVCQVTENAMVNRVSGILCNGEVNSTRGRLLMDFASVQCDHEGTYVCECNPEASTQKQTSLSITRPTQNPVFTSVPKTLVENTQLLEMEMFTCEADLGYPSANLLILQSNKDGTYETYDDEFGVGRTFLNENCSVFETVTVNHYAFDSSWNNTKLRCAITDVNGTITTYASDEITILLIPETFCNDSLGYYLHPYDIHLYVRCTESGLFVYTCNELCPTIIDGAPICDHCDTS